MNELIMDIWTEKLKNKNKKVINMLEITKILSIILEFKYFIYLLQKLKKNIRNINGDYINFIYCSRTYTSLKKKHILISFYKLKVQ